MATPLSLASVTPSTDASTDGSFASNRNPSISPFLWWFEDVGSALVSAGITRATASAVSPIPFTGAGVGTPSEEPAVDSRTVKVTETNTLNSVGALLTTHGSSGS